MKKYNLPFQQALKNTLLIVTIIVLFTPIVYAAKPQVRPISNLIVVDANGKKVGNVLTTSEFEATVALDIKGFLIVLDVIQSGFVNSSSVFLIFGAIGFESKDCSGVPLIPVGSGLVPPSVIGAPAPGVQGSEVYVVSPNTTPVTATIRSLLDQGGNCGPPIHGPISSTFLPTVRLIDLSTVFTPPFTMQEGK